MKESLRGKYSRKENWKIICMCCLRGHLFLAGTVIYLIKIDLQLKGKIITLKKKKNQSQGHLLQEKRFSHNMSRWQAFLEFLAVNQFLYEIQSSRVTFCTLLK